MRRSVGRSALYGVLFGLATAAVAEAVRPRGGTTLLVDWDEVRRTAHSRLERPRIEPGRLASVATGYRGRADKLEKPLLDFVGPQLMSAEPIGGEGLYLVETNVEEWQNHAKLPDQDLRRWLILHEMTHAWQFAAHPWLRPHMEESMRVLIDSVTRKGPGVARFAAFAGVLPAQWRVMRLVQGTMSVIEGYSNLVMNQLGSKLLPGFDLLEKAYRERTSGKSALEVLIWKLTGLDLKLQQYQRGEAFCRAVYDAYGMAVLNRVWDGPESMPTLRELGN